MIVIGVCGASGSGKSTLAKTICGELACSSLIIGQDCYYKDHSHLPFEERVRINYDEPEVFDHDALLEDVERLGRGEAVTRKGYDYAAHMRADSAECRAVLAVMQSAEDRISAAEKASTVTAKKEMKRLF